MTPRSLPHTAFSCHRPSTSRSSSRTSPRRPPSSTRSQWSAAAAWRASALPSGCSSCSARPLHGDAHRRLQVDARREQQRGGGGGGGDQWQLAAAPAHWWSRGAAGGLRRSRRMRCSTRAHAVCEGGVRAAGAGARFLIQTGPEGGGVLPWGVGGVRQPEGTWGAWGSRWRRGTDARGARGAQTENVLRPLYAPRVRFVLVKLT